MSPKRETPEGVRLRRERGRRYKEHLDAWHATPEGRAEALSRFSDHLLRNTRSWMHLHRWHRVIDRRAIPRRVSVPDAVVQWRGGNPERKRANDRRGSYVRAEP